MRPQRPITEADLKQLKQGLKKAQSVIEYRHMQVLYLRGCFGSTIKEVAGITQYSVQRVSSILESYFKHGLGAVTELNAPRQRKWGNMPFKEERAFIAAYLDKAKNGEIIEVSAIKKAYEERIGKETSPSVIYNILHRHGWRKIVPRPAHPKQDKEKSEAFKKTLWN